LPRADIPDTKPGAAAGDLILIALAGLSMPKTKLPIYFNNGLEWARVGYTPAEYRQACEIARTVLAGQSPSGLALSLPDLAGFAKPAAAHPKSKPSAAHPIRRRLTSPLSSGGIGWPCLASAKRTIGAGLEAGAAPGQPGCLCPEGLLIAAGFPGFAERGRRMTGESFKDHEQVARAALRALASLGHPRADFARQCSTGSELDATP